MKEIIRTNDPTVVSYVTHLLRAAGVEAFVFDINASILEGSIGILPRRIMVANAEYAEARKLVHDAGLAHELEKHQE